MPWEAAENQASFAPVHNKRRVSPELQAPRSYLPKSGDGRAAGGRPAAALSRID